MFFINACVELLSFSAFLMLIFMLIFCLCEMEIGFHLYFFLKLIATFPGYDSIYDVQKLNLVF